MLANPKQKISYAKSKSNIIAKLDGTFKLPTVSSAAQVEVTDLQQSIFNAPLPGVSTSAAPAAQGLPTKPPGADQVMADAGTAESSGVKRPREEQEEEESDEDVAMEEESDDE